MGLGSHLWGSQGSGVPLMGLSTPLMGQGSHLWIRGPHLWLCGPTYGSGSPVVGQPWVRAPTYGLGPPLMGQGRHLWGSRGAHLIVEGADVQRGVPRRVLSRRLRPIEQQMLQVLRVAVLARLGGTRGSGGLWGAIVPPGR